MKNLKYPLSLFIFLLLAKCGYIVIESFYNYDVLNITTSAHISRDEVDTLNIRGHLIASAGITLLLIPFLFFIFKRFSKTIMYSCLIISSLVLYIGIYNSLNKVVDIIVLKNKEHRHDAYYTNLFKYGVLNGVFAYEDFIDKETVKSGNFSVKDKLLLSNTFLLTFADAQLLQRLKDRGRNSIARLYIETELKDDYEEKYENYKTVVADLSSLWSSFDSERKKLKSEIDKAKDESAIKNSYKKLSNTLDKKYSNYKNAFADIDKIIKKETELSSLINVKDELDRYFENKKYKKAQDMYKTKMIEKFGHTIDPDRWCNGNRCPTIPKISKVIKEEIYAKAKKNTNNMSPGLSRSKFLQIDSVKQEVIKQLKSENILVPYDFDYSYSQFKMYYEVPLSKKVNQAIREFYSTLELKIGKNDLLLDFTWDQFLDSKYISNSIEKGISDDRISKKSILDTIKTYELSNFMEMIYLPIVKDEVSNAMYSYEDFQKDDKVALIGDDSIKLLYIPPFALALSILALLLNTVTVIFMLLSLTKLSKIKLFAIQCLVFTILIILPFLINTQNSKMEKFSQEIVAVKQYIKFLNWLNFYEEINMKIHTK